MNAVRRTRRRGKIGPIQIDFGSGSTSIAFNEIAQPDTKEELEAYYAQRFITSFNVNPLIPELLITGCAQNRENDLDFRLTTSDGDKWLDVMEVAPFEFFALPPDAAPNSYKPYELAKFLHKKIMDKSRKYRSQRSDDMFLLLYLTDWRFDLSDTCISLIRYWCNRKKNSFSAIFLYLPFDEVDGHASLIAPTSSESWRGFDPEACRDNDVINLDPSKWQVRDELSRQ